MTMIDYNTRLTPTAQAVTTTAVTTDVFPLSVAGRDFAIGEPMCLVFTVTVAALVAGTETYEFQVQTATAADGTTGGVVIASSGVFTVSSGAIARGSLAAGQKVVVPIGPGAIPATATHLVGKFTTANSAGITCLVDLMPLSAVATFKAHVGKPSYPTGG